MPAETQHRLCELQGKVFISTLVYLGLAFILLVTAVFAHPRQKRYEGAGGREEGRKGGREGGREGGEEGGENSSCKSDLSLE